MTSTSPPAAETLYCDPGADLVEEFFLPGNYAAATGEMHVRSNHDDTIIVSGTVTFGAYGADLASYTKMTLTIADTATDDLNAQRAYYDVLVTLGSLKEFWLHGDFIINNRMTQPGVP